MTLVVLISFFFRNHSWQCLISLVFFYYYSYKNSIDEDFFISISLVYNFSHVKTWCWENINTHSQHAKVFLNWGLAFKVLRLLFVKNYSGQCLLLDVFTTSPVKNAIDEEFFISINLVCNFSHVMTRCPENVSSNSQHSHSF